MRAMKILAKNPTVKIIFAALLLCYVHANEPSQILPEPVLVEQASNDTRKRMVVLVHGTILPKLSFGAFKKALKKMKVDERFTHSCKMAHGSFAKRYRYHLRHNTYHPHQAIGELGLHAINGEELHPAHVSAASIFPALCEPAHECATRNPPLGMYTFGWDGALDKRSRYEWAGILYDELVAEAERIEQQTGQKPEIELWCHSHGGNVALHLADWEGIRNKSLQASLVLMGTPIQSETEDLVDSPVFEKIFNIYSHRDIVQKLDCISSKDYFSRRRFSQKPATSKLTQIQISVGTDEPMHGELWLFGNTFPFVYRSWMAFHPVPLVVFTPAIIDLIDSTFPDEHDVDISLVRNDDVVTVTATTLNEKADESNQVATISFNGFNRLSETISEWQRNRKQRAAQATSSQA